MIIPTKTLKKARRILKRIQLPSIDVLRIASIFLLLVIVLPLQISAAPIPDNKVDINMDGFVLSGAYSVVAGQPTATGQIKTGNVGAYPEGGCIPTLVDVRNNDNKTGDIDFRVSYDYYKTQGGNSFIGIAQLEQLTTALADPNTSVNLNEFGFTGVDLVTVNQFLASDGLPVSAAVTGPYSTNNPGNQPTSATDAQRHYNISLLNVPSGVTVHVLMCSRLGLDASLFPGSSMSATAGNGNGGGGGGGNLPIDTSALMQLPSLTVNKTVVGGTATSDQWTFNVSPAINGLTTLTIPVGQTSVVVENISPDANYTVSENAGPADYALTSISGTSCTAGGIATVAAGKPPVNAVCTFTNTYSPAPPPTTLTVTKIVVNDNGGLLAVSDFPLFVNGTSVTSGISNLVTPGSYTVSETSNPNYTGTFSGDCDVTGNVILAEGDNKTCTLTNDDMIVLPVVTTGTIIVIKNVINDNTGTAVAGDFTMNVTATNPSLSSFPGSTVGTSVTVDLGAYSVAETPASGYASVLSADCTGTMGAGEVKTCTITNDDIAIPPPPPTPTATTGTLIVINNVINDNGGTAAAGDFTMNVTGVNPSSATFAGSLAGTYVTLDEGAYAVTETPVSGYTTTYSTDCTGTMATGTTMTCTVTNDDIAPPPPPPPATGTLIVQVLVINDNGGDRPASNFQITASGTNISQTSFWGDSAGTVLTLGAGAYSVYEEDPANYLKNMSADCVGSILAGETKTCVITNDDQVRTGGSGTDIFGGGGGGGGTVSPAVSAPPTGVVLGVEDTIDPPVPTPVATPTLPEPRVLGIATELPRTGFPIEVLAGLSLALGLAVVRRTK